jgi:hypothetical protein
MALNSYKGSFLAHRVIVLQVKKQYSLNPSHCDILLLIEGLAPGSRLINITRLKAYSTGKTSYYVSKWVYGLLERGFIYDLGDKPNNSKKRNNYRLTATGQEVVDYIYRALHDRVKYINDRMKIAEGLKRDRSKEQTKRKTAAARLRREQARLNKLNNLSLDIPPHPANE